MYITLINHLTEDCFVLPKYDKNASQSKEPKDFLEVSFFIIDMHCQKPFQKGLLATSSKKHLIGKKT